MVEARYVTGKRQALPIFSTKRYRDATGGMIGTMNFQTNADPTVGIHPSKTISIGSSLLRFWPVLLSQGIAKRAKGWIVKFGDRKWDGAIEVCSKKLIPSSFKCGKVMMVCGLLAGGR